MEQYLLSEIINEKLIPSRLCFEISFDCISSSSLSYLLIIYFLNEFLISSCKLGTEVEINFC